MGAVRWGPDGRRLLLSSNLKGQRGLFALAGDGSGKPDEVFLHPKWWVNTFSPHPGGTGVLLSAQKTEGHDLLFLREGGGDPEPFLATAADEQQPAFSPDGRLVAYVSNETGHYQVYLRPFPGPGRKRQVSSADGGLPRWRRDGKELFFFEGNRLMAVTVEPGPEPRISKPQPLFEVSPEGLSLNYDVMPDGQRFVMVKPGHAADAPLQLVVVPGFLEEMKARLAGKRSGP